MEKKERARNRYFQEIAHEFLKSLRVALEGMERAFESYKAKPVARRKILSLAFCKNQVLRAFEQYKERKVGAPKKKNERDRKQKRIKEEVQKFLGDIPPALSYLNDLYTQALMVLSKRKVAEEELERMEEEIEELLFKNSPQEDKEKIKKEISEDLLLSEEEFFSIYKTRQVKFLRETYKIPYISFFYY